MPPKNRRQLGFRFRTWGGKRKGAGRKPSGPRAGVPHRSRPSFARPLPLHVTLRVAKGVWNLRSRRSFRVLERAFLAGGDRFGARVVQFSIQGNHLHLLVEAADTRALERAIKGLSIRIARGLNALMDRSGRVLGDRYHARTLRTPSEVRRAADYIRHNFRRHAAARGERLPPRWIDPYCSEAPEHILLLPAPRTCLVRALRPRGP